MLENHFPYEKPIPGIEEKSVPVMVYLRNSICWGDIFVKQTVRVSTWLRTNAAPDIISIHNARILMTVSSGNKPAQIPEIHFSTSEVLAFHIIPPETDPLDYDPNEPNRHMDPVTIFTANFRMDGFMRMAGSSTLSKYIEITREVYSSLYDVDISCPIIPALGVMHVPYVLVRQIGALFAVRNLPTPTVPT